MTLEELEASLRQTCLDMFESDPSKPSDSPELELMMRAIWFLARETSLLNSRLAETETQVSTLELGLKRLEENQETTDEHDWYHPLRPF